MTPFTHLLTEPRAAAPGPLWAAGGPAEAGGGRLSVEEAKAFQEFPLYWVSENFQDLPLVAILRSRYNPDPTLPASRGENMVTFIYGRCEPKGEGGCAPPLAIQVTPYCQVPPTLLAERVKNEPPSQLRGAQAQWVGQRTSHLRLWTKNVNVAIFAGDRALLTAAADALRPVSLPADQRPGDLGPPTVGSC